MSWVERLGFRHNVRLAGRDTDEDEEEEEGEEEDYEPRRKREWIGVLTVADARLQSVAPG